MSAKSLLFKLIVSTILTACTTAKSLSPLKSEPKEENPVPSITKAKVRSYVVPDTIEGNKYIKSHRIFILEDPGSWSKD